MPTCPTCGKFYKAVGNLTTHQKKGCAKAPVVNREILVRRREMKRKDALEEENEDIEVAASSITEPEPAQPEPAAEVIMPKVSVGTSRAGRQRFQPRYLQDYVPTLSVRLPSVLPRPPTPPPPDPEPAGPPPNPPTPEPSPPPEPTRITTEPDEFGLYRVYSKYPAKIPDEEVGTEEVCEGAGYQAKNRSNPLSIFGLSDPDFEGIFAPFLNATVFRIMSWFYGPKNTKSIAGLDSLVNEVILADDFNREDLVGFRTQRELERLDDYAKPRSNLCPKDGWVEAEVCIRLPAEDVEQKEEDAPEFPIPNVFYRKPLEIIKSAFQSDVAKKFHYVPFQQFWQPPPPSPNDPPPPSQRIYSEIYNSDAFIQEYEKIQTQEYHNPRPQSNDLNDPPIENAIAAMLWWSDSTHLTSFGDASLWPLYLFFGNQSKYDRAKPTTFSAHHTAYIPDLPDNIQEWYQDLFGVPASGATLTHLKREIMHAIWALILDDDFMHAYEHGILIQCADGVVRRIFPRFFTYSADYPEKVLLATIRNLGRCPCTQCCVEKDQIHELGMLRDRQRRERKARVDTEDRRSTIERVRTWIFAKGRAVASSAVEAVLQAKSWVPTRNTFSERFHKFGMNFYSMLVPDILHEFELGVWKATFIHLLRILCSIGGDSIQKLNSRYRMVPTFGRDTIRKFSVNVSAMKQLAARDFEDLLQCSIPVFDGLIPDHNSIVLDLLYDLCTWHAYAKLRLHSDTSIADMDFATTSLGKSLRRFKTAVCSAYITKELPKETAARGRRKAALAKKQAETGNTKRKRTGGASGAKKKQFNINTYKLHALGHYIRFLRLVGTTDNYSTQIGELEHRRVKRFYARTNKAKFVKQVANHERREQIIRRIEARVVKGKEPQKPSDSEPPLVTSPNTHHFISADCSNWFNIREWMNKHSGDPAVEDFLFKLKNHLLSVILNCRDDQFSSKECASVKIINDRIYRHKVLDVQYTSYDLRRCQDSVNLGNHPDVMVLAGEREPDSHPYWYARTLGIFHARVYYEGDGRLRDITFLWVRWFTLDTRYKFGPAKKRLPRVGWVDSTEPGAIGFLDPQHVLRAAHLVPAFALGKRSDLMAPTIARRDQDEGKDWNRHYVCIFVDRDMFSRYVPGIAVGHTTHLPKCHEVPQEQPEGQPMDESELVDEEMEVSSGEENESELDDYGYRDSDEECQSEIAFEDESVDDTTDVLRAEGYAHL
ncbi:hypothetical protein PM082_006258 [Marasmius tenuissimus]|nr:hypothetical protein PM082_006258 [Marasmius tenuissimus]